MPTLLLEKTMSFLTAVHYIPHSPAVSFSAVPAPKELRQTVPVQTEWVRTLEDRLEEVLNLVKLTVKMQLQAVA